MKPRLLFYKLRQDRHYQSRLLTHCLLSDLFCIALNLPPFKGHYYPFIQDYYLIRAPAEYLSDQKHFCYSLESYLHRSSVFSFAFFPL